MQIDNLKDPEDETITSKPAVHPVTPISYMAMNHHPDLLAASLIASLEWLACDFQIKNQIPFTFRTDAHDCATESLLTIGVFHIAQEACHNISQHAHASSVAMYLHVANDIL